MTQKPPELESSTADERRRFVRTKYPCIANCEQCGQCAIFHGHDAETAFADYINGRREFAEVLKDYRR